MVERKGFPANMGEVHGNISFKVFDLPVALEKAFDCRTIKITYTRRWRERLFSRPWQPLVKKKTYELHTSTPPEIRSDGEHMLVKFFIDPEVTP